MNDVQHESHNLVEELDAVGRLKVAADWALAAQHSAEITQDPYALEIWNLIFAR